MISDEQLEPSAERPRWRSRLTRPGPLAGRYPAVAAMHCRAAAHEPAGDEPDRRHGQRRLCDTRHRCSRELASMPRGARPSQHLPSPGGSLDSRRIRPVPSQATSRVAAGGSIACERSTTAIPRRARNARAAVSACRIKRLPGWRRLKGQRSCMDGSGAWSRLASLRKVFGRGSHSYHLLSACTVRANKPPTGRLPAAIRASRSA